MLRNFRARATLGVVSLLLFVSSAYADGLSDQYKIAEKLGNGAYKDVYAVEGHPELALGILRAQWQKQANVLEAEKAMLDKIAAAGVPTATVLEISTYNGQIAYLQKRFATANRAPDWNAKRWEVLNQTSIDDVHRIEAALVQAHMNVSDAQFLVGADGHVVLNDPLGIGALNGPVSSAKGVLDQIERAAHEAIDARNTKLLQSMDEAKDPVLAQYFSRAKVALQYGDAAGEAALKEALLHYIESGNTTPVAQEVAKSIRDGTFEVELLRPNQAPTKPAAVAVALDQSFPKLAHDLVEGGVKKLRAVESTLETDFVAALHAFDFMGAKAVPEPIANDSKLPSEPTALAQALADRNGVPLDDATRAHLEEVARGIRDRGADVLAPRVGASALLERDLGAEEHAADAR